MEDLKYIEDEIKNKTKHLRDDFKPICCAKNKNGKPCSNIASINNKLCKKHKTFTLNERKTCDIIYHNHLPSIKFCENCPRCLISNYQVNSP